MIIDQKQYFLCFFFSEEPAEKKPKPEVSSNGDASAAMAPQHQHSQQSVDPNAYYNSHWNYVSVT